MTWQEKIIAVHTSVNDAVSHLRRMKSDRYFVWAEDSRNDFEAGDKHAEKAIEGTTDLWTKQEFDPWVQQFEDALDAADVIAWYCNVENDYDEETGFHHYEWVWQIPVGVYPDG